MKSVKLSVVLMLITAVATPVVAQSDDPPPPVAVSRIDDTLYQLRCNENVGVVASIGEDGILLVDTGYAQTAEAVRDELAQLTEGPVQIIINTHGDGDHVGGNAVLGGQAVIVAHPEVRRQMSSYFALPLGEPDGLPAMTLGGDATIFFNDEKIHIIPMPGGHTSGDSIVHFTRIGIACIGDLVLLGTFPNAAPARGGDAQRLIEVLKWIRETLPPDTTLLAAHGGTFSMAELETYIEMVEDTVTAVAAEVAEGRSLAEIVEENPLAPWSEWESAANGLSYENWITEIHASLVGSETQSICAPLTEVLVDHDGEAAAARYHQLKKDNPTGFSFAENELNMLGYQLLALDRVDDAIAIFELNVEAFPDGFNTYDSLAESLMIAGRTAEAITNYEKSLDLNPDNTNAVAMLARLRAD